MQLVSSTSMKSLQRSMIGFPSVGSCAGHRPIRMKPAVGSTLPVLIATSVILVCPFFLNPLLVYLFASLHSEQVLVSWTFLRAPSHYLLGSHTAWECWKEVNNGPSHTIWQSDSLSSLFEGLT